MTPDGIVASSEPPFAEYEALVRQVGERSEAYRELRFSFVEIDGRKLTYVDLLNRARRSNGGEAAPFVRADWAHAAGDRGATLRLAADSLEALRRELDAIRRGHRATHVLFADEALDVPLSRLTDLCRLLISERSPVRWFGRLRGHADEAAVDLMARSGCKGVCLDVGSGSPAVLASMSTRPAVEHYDRLVRRLEARGILTFASFVLGFPGETAETVHETADFIEAARPGYYRVQPWYCARGAIGEPRRSELELEGDGFVWQHATMDSVAAADHLERLFLTVRGSQWLPRWSFDFSIIPQLFGAGLDAGSFHRFMIIANRLLALDIAGVGRHEKRKSQATLLRQLSAWGAGLRLAAPEPVCDEVAP